MSAEKSTATIYGLSDPRTGAIRYVGKTINSLQRRLRQHCAESAHRKSYKDNWIRSLLDQGLRPDIVELEVVGEDWEKAERRWIRKLRRTCRLTNQTDGGEVGGWGFQGGELCPSSVLTERQVVDISERYAAGGVTQAELAEEFGVGVGAVASIVRGRTWKHVPRPITIREWGAPGVSRKRPRGFGVGERHHMTKLTAEQVIEMRERYAAGGITQVELAAEYGISQSGLSGILLRKTWQHL